MVRYSSWLKAEIAEEQKEGQSVKNLSKEYGISRYAIQCVCGLRPERNIINAAPLRRGRSRKTPITTQKELEIENKRLKMENELLRDFLRLAGRK